MPGKVNPSQAEVVLMVCMEIIGADVTVSMAGAEGNFELNAFRPIVIANHLLSAMGPSSSAARRTSDNLTPTMPIKEFSGGSGCRGDGPGQARLSAR